MEVTFAAYIRSTRALRKKPTSQEPYVVTNLRESSQNADQGLDDSSNHTNDISTYAMLYHILFHSGLATESSSIIFPVAGSVTIVAVVT